MFKKSFILSLGLTSVLMAVGPFDLTDEVLETWSANYRGAKVARDFGFEDGAGNPQKPTDKSSFVGYCASFTRSSYGRERAYMAIGHLRRELEWQGQHPNRNQRPYVTGHWYLFGGELVQNGDVEGALRRVRHEVQTVTAWKQNPLFPYPSQRKTQELPPSERHGNLIARYCDLNVRITFDTGTAHPHETNFQVMNKGMLGRGLGTAALRLFADFSAHHTNAESFTGRSDGKTAPYHAVGFKVVNHQFQPFEPGDYRDPEVTCFRLPLRPLPNTATITPHDII